MAAVHDHSQPFLFSSVPSSGKITEKMASAPPFLPTFPIPSPFLLPPPVLQHILGFNQVRQICVLYQPLPLPPKMANSVYQPLPDADGSKMKKGAWFWMTKEEAERKRQRGHLQDLKYSPSSPEKSRFADSVSSASMEFNEMNPQGDTRTTVMIRNVPNKLRRALLVKLLDEHCAEENRRLGSSTDTSEFDFVYLPVDFRTNGGLGYAFVNFTTPQAARRFHAAMEKHRWGLFETRKVGHVCYARIQGKEAMMANFGASIFRCDSDEFLPVTFSPARNGAPPFPPETVVGRRLARFISSETEAAAQSGGTP